MHVSYVIYNYISVLLTNLFSTNYAVYYEYFTTVSATQYVQK